MHPQCNDAFSNVMVSFYVLTQPFCRIRHRFVRLRMMSTNKDSVESLGEMAKKGETL